MLLYLKIKKIPSIISCSKEMFNFYSLTGVPDLNLPVLEPMSISNIDFNVADGAFAAILSNMQIRGLSKFITRNLT